MDWLKRLLGRFRRSPVEESPFVAISMPGGPPMLADREILAFLQSTAPAPSQATLDALLGRVHGIRVIAGGCARGRPIGDEVLLETVDPEALSGLRAALRIVDAEPDNVSHCMCFGDPTIELLDREGARLAAIGSHHGESIRWDEWNGDGELVDGLALLRWFAHHGVTYPMDEYTEVQGQARVGEWAHERWLAAMPPCLAPLAERLDHAFAGDYGIDRDGESGRRAQLTEAASKMLEAAYPTGAERVGALFDWFGSGEGPWSGCPAYESAAQALLMTLPRGDMLRALEGADLPHARIEGAARLFALWPFREAGAGELDTVPEALKAQLLRHALQSEDEDKRERAQRAFGPR